MPSPRPPSRMTSCLALCALLAASCFSGVKYARRGETCKSGDQVFEGAVECAGGLTCLAVEIYGPGNRRGVCTPACGPDEACPAGLVCAAGACVSPCPPDGAVCPSDLNTFSVCCHSPAVAVCLPKATCHQWGVTADAGTSPGDGGAP